MKRFYYAISGMRWTVFDRLRSIGGGTVCTVDEPEVASIICDALNAAYPQREDRL